MSEVAERVKAIIVDKLPVEENEVTPEAEFSKDLGADSLDTVELIMEFEKEFGLTIPEDKANEIKTVGDAIKYIEEHTAEYYGCVFTRQARVGKRRKSGFLTLQKINESLHITGGSRFINPGAPEFPAAKNEDTWN